MLFGITGGSGSGKSYVADIFRKYGFFIIDTDKTGHEIIKKGREAYYELIEKFGAEILAEDGEIDRRKLGSIVFSDKDKLSMLNSVTHPHIKSEIYSLAEKNGGISGVDGALLIECGIECSPLIAVIADKNIRADRIIKRDGIDRELAVKRINSQKSDEFYRSHCDFIIENNEGISEENIKNIVDRLRNWYE